MIREKYVESNKDKHEKGSNRDKKSISRVVQTINCQVNTFSQSILFPFFLWWCAVHQLFTPERKGLLLLKSINLNTLSCSD